MNLGGGETIRCPQATELPLASMARRLGLGSTSLALPPARVHLLEDVLVCTNRRVVADVHGRIVSESITSDMHGFPGLVPDPGPVDALEVDGTVALFRSPWRPHYHTLIDHLPRAALLAQPAMRRLGPITLVHDGPLSPIEAALLPRLLPGQVTLLEVEPGRCVRADRVALPDYVTRPAAGAVPSWYRRFVDRESASALRRSRTSGSRRIFVDRTSGPRKVLNRSELDPVLERHGVEPVEPSMLSAQQQMALFRSAELVVGVTGSGLANCVFSERAHVVELAPGRELRPHFLYLAAAKGLSYAAVLEPPDRLRLSAEERLRRDVRVDTEQLDRVLASVA